MTKSRDDQRWSPHSFPPLTHALLRAIAQERSKRGPRIYLAQAMHDALIEYAKRHHPGLVNTVTSAQTHASEAPEASPQP